MCKYVPPLSVALGSRSSAPDESLHSLHKCVSFHLIRSPRTKRIAKHFAPVAIQSEASVLILFTLEGTEDSAVKNAVVFFLPNLPIDQESYRARSSPISK
jgi:hypothetical protein